MKRGCFISLEGGEGVGKSTNLLFLKQFLEENHIPVTVTREPGGTAVAEKIRGILLERQEEEICEQAELLLLFAARAQHIIQVILPALQNGRWVLCDRFTDATYAYQGGGRRMNLQTIAWLENIVQGDLRPDLTVVFDAPAEIGLHRAKSRGNLDRFEIEDCLFFERVRDMYLYRAGENPQQYKIVDAGLPLSDVQKRLRQIMADLMAER